MYETKGPRLVYEVIKKIQDLCTIHRKREQASQVRQFQQQHQLRKEEYDRLFQYLT